MLAATTPATQDFPGGEFRFFLGSRLDGCLCHIFKYLLSYSLRSGTPSVRKSSSPSSARVAVVVTVTWKPNMV